jgi:hypothetical protein
VTIATRIRPSTRGAALLGAAAALLLAACSSSSGGGETEDIVAQVPFRDGERFVYQLIDRDGALVGRGTFTTTRDGDAFALTQSYDEAGEASEGRTAIDASRAIVDASTLRPRSMERTILGRDGDDDETVTAVYETDAEGEPVVRTTRVTGDDERERDLDLREHHYEDQSSLWLWRTLALGEDLDVRYTAVDPREGSQVTANAIQVDRQVRESPAGAFDTWVIQIRTGRETANVWVHVEPPHEVVRFDNGRLFFELESADLGGG